MISRFFYIIFTQVMTDTDLLKAACEQFLGRSIMEIKSTLLHTLEGHLRCILGMFYSMLSRFPLNVLNAIMDFVEWSGYI